MSNLSIEAVETEEDTTLWYLINNDTQEKINLAELIEEDHIEEAEILEGNIIQVCYTDYSGWEAMCLIHSNKRIITKAMAEPLIQCNKKRNHFILLLNTEFSNFNRTSGLEEGLMYAVIDSFGDYVIEPKFEEIEYNETHDIYICNNTIYNDEEDILGTIIAEENDLIVFEADNKKRIMNKGTIAEIKLDTIDLTHSCFTGEFQNAIVNEKFKNSSINPHFPVAIKNCLIVSIEGKYGIVNSDGETVIDFIFSALEYKFELTEKTKGFYSLFYGKYLNGVHFYKPLDFDDTIKNDGHNGNFSFLKFLYVELPNLRRPEAIFIGYKNNGYYMQDSEREQGEAPDLFNEINIKRLNNSNIYNQYLICKTAYGEGIIEAYFKNEKDSPLTILDINLCVNFSKQKIQTVYANQNRTIIGFLLLEANKETYFTPIVDLDLKIPIVANDTSEILEEIKRVKIYDFDLGLG